MKQDDRLKKMLNGESIFDVEFGELCGEEVKIQSKVDVAKLTEGDAAPFFATVKAVKVGVSKNRKNYSMEILKQIRDQLPLYGYKGHITDEELSHVFREPVTVWIGGEISGDWLYVKGYIPPQYADLRKNVELSLRVGKPLPVSILGFLKMKPNGENFDVLEWKGLSIDWANDGVEGVEGAHVIKIGKETKEESMPTKEEILAALTADEIKKARPDLVKGLEAEMQGSEEAKKKQADEKKKLETLEKENLDLKKKLIDGHRAKLLGEVQDEKVRAIAGDLLKGETTEELDASWKTVKEKLATIEKPGMPIIAGVEHKKEGSDFLREELC